MARVTHGDEEAFADLYDHGAGQVFGLVRQIVHDPVRVEEVYQEIWVQVWRSADRYDPADGPVMPWIMTVAHRRAVDRVRSERFRERPADSGSAFPFEPAGDSVAEHAEYRAVRHGLSTLTKPQYDSVQRAYFGGLTHGELGEESGVPAPTVETWIRDGLIRLRDCLQRPGPLRS